MSQIIDYAYNYTTTTTGTTIACDVPDTATNDLLIAVLSADTGTPTWSCTGWTQKFTLTNTTNTALMWRISTGGSEPASYTFTSSVQETLNCTIVSIRDVDTTTPFVDEASVNRAANNTAYPQITTNRDNCLILYLDGHGTTAVIPSCIEGPVTQLFQMDGSAHSNSIGWSIQAAQGSTPSTVISSVTGTTYNGKLITLGVRPPSGGATLIPAYCSADASVYLDPIHGVTAFRGNAVYASTNVTSTYTGTNPLGGKSIAAATVSARIDTGINSYRSTGGQTSSTNRTWQGSLLQFASAKTTMAGKNILLHVQTYLPADIQTLEGIGLSRGVAVGFHTSNGNWKGWHVHGANTPFGVKMVPVVVNTGNTTGQIGSQGSLNTASIAGIGTFVSGFVASADMIWTMMWQLDTTTVCGGIAATPIDIPGIVRAVANGHERLSALQQGKNQMLVMQPIQIGDGTNPVYLDVSTAAIEFPQQYNVASGQVFYCSTDNVAGVTFYPKAGDTFNLSSSAWSSASKFHFRFHASSSASATVSTEGMQVIGAGDVQLQSAVPLTSVSFTNCPTITQNACVITGSSFTNSKVTSASPGDADNISNSDFTSSGTGHAIEIGGTAANITLTGLTFTGYSGTSTNAAIYVNIASGDMTITISGGTTPSIRTAGANVTVVAGAVSVTVTTKDIDGATVGSANVFLKAASGGSGILPVDAAITLARSGATATATHSGAHNLSTSDQVLIQGAGDPLYNGVFTITVTGTTTYTYTMNDTPSAATDSGTATFVFLKGTTHATTGILSMSRVFTADQNVTGWARKYSTPPDYTPPNYKTSNITGTVLTSDNFSATVLLISDD